ncbi:MAG: redoxin domain-containing protein [Chromatiaceae bacterium]|nr:redoxin domain-containing protein [Chromatiaceae bacterium]
MLMKTVMTTLLFTLATTAGAALRIGEPAPGFTGIDTRGNSHALSDYRGKPVILEWTNHDCPYVRKHYNSGNMQQQQRAATDQGAVWLSIISSAPGKQGHVTPAQADTLTVERNAAPSAVILDENGEIGRLYGAKTTPHMYIIDADGKLAYMGGIDSIASSNPADIEKAIQYVPAALARVMNGEPVASSVTRPYGCSVKY